MAYFHSLSTPRLQNAPSSDPSETERHPLAEPSLFYDPPYERPVEDEFAWHLVKYLNPITSLDYQHSVRTTGASFWVDFVVEDGVRRIGFECGELRDNSDPQQMRYRDALVIGSGHLDILYRLRGLDLLHRLHDCLYLVAQREAALFSERGHINLRTLASETARTWTPKRHQTVFSLSYPTGDASIEDHLFGLDESVMPSNLIVRRLDRTQPEAWLRDYDRALAYYGVAPDAISRHWAKSA